MNKKMTLDGRARMTMEEALVIGRDFLRLTPQMMKASHEMARLLQQDALKKGDIKVAHPEDLPPMMLAMGLIGIAHVEREDPTFHKELSDALEVVTKAEREYRLRHVRAH